jgi:hypothetical protein
MLSKLYIGLILSFRLACARCLGIRNLSGCFASVGRIPDALRTLKAPTFGAGMTPLLSVHITPVLCKTQHQVIAAGVTFSPETLETLQPGVREICP